MPNPISYEPIRVADPDFHIRKSIDQCPSGLMERELIKNGFEAVARADEPGGMRRIDITTREIDGVKKLTFRNTGRGMTADELVAATDLASSIGKKLGLEGRENRGEGAKVASLPWNGEGMIYRSCHHGAVSAVVLRRINDRYVREKHELHDDDGAVTYGSVWDVTNDVVAQGYRVDHDWTEVTLVGNTAGQDTICWPYGHCVGAGEKRTVLTNIVDRFYDFPRDAKVFASDEFHGRKSDMELRPMARAFERHEREQDFLGERIRRESVGLDSGVRIEFVHLQLFSGGNTLMGRYELAGDPTRIALVWRGEMYDAVIGKLWSHKAASFQLPLMHRRMSVFIHLPDDWPVRDDAYRLNLARTDSGEQVEVEDFQADVRAARPKWVRDLVERAQAPRHATDMKEVEEILQKRLREARIRLPDAALSGTPVATAGGSGSGTETGRGTPNVPMVTDPDAPAPTPRPSGPSAKAPGRKKTKARRAVSRAPHIVWLDKDEQVKEGELEERAGRYEPVTNKLYLNALHSSVAGKVKFLEDRYAPQVSLEAVRDEIIDQVKVAMALHIGTTVVCALAKEGLRTWEVIDLEKASSSEALTVSADNSEMLMRDIQISLGNRASFKAAKIA